MVTERIVTQILLTCVGRRGARFVGDDTDKPPKTWPALLKKPRPMFEKLRRIQRRDNVGEIDASRRIHDALRYETELGDAREFGRKAADILNDMLRHGFRLESCRDGFGELARYRQSGADWAHQKVPYAGLNLKMRTADGSPFEVQFHTKQSRKMHQRNHKAYEKWRNLPPLSSLASDPETHDADLEAHDTLFDNCTTPA